MKYENKCVVVTNGEKSYMFCHTKALDKDKVWIEDENGIGGFHKVDMANGLFSLLTKKKGFKVTHEDHE